MNRRLFRAWGLSALLLLPALPVRADEGPGEAVNEYDISSPYVVAGQTELELRVAQFQDSSEVVDGTRGVIYSLGHAFTDWWRPEVYFGKYRRDPRQPNDLVGYEFENTFQLTDVGEYWADTGFLLSYEYATHEGEPNALEFGPLFEKDAGGFRQRLNLLWEKQLGSLKEEAGYEFRTAYSVNWLWRAKFKPGLDLFARPGSDVYQLGPSLAGEWHVGRSEIEYDAGVVFGLGPKAPDTTFLLRLEYEFF